MGIYLPNMEMPRNGQMLVIFPDGTSYVCFNGMRERLTQTTAVPVPPHGDLIDQDEYRDEFMNGVYALCSDDSDNYRANAIIDLFDEAPTIIPAEDGET